VTVSKGWITLSGEVEWWYLKDAAEAAVLHLTGVKEVSNSITIKPRLKADDIETDIANAFKRSALFDARKIEVTVTGNKVELRGTVRNSSERDEVEQAAWAAPGVYSVSNLLDVEWSWFSD